MLIPTGNHSCYSAAKKTGSCNIGWITGDFGENACSNGLNVAGWNNNSDSYEKFTSRQTVRYPEACSDCAVSGGGLYGGRKADAYRNAFIVFRQKHLDLIQMQLDIYGFKGYINFIT